MPELLLGCGSRTEKVLYHPERREWTELVRLDINPEHNPDVAWDLTDFPYPFADNTFDEIHAYEVLEHLGKQGDYQAFFREWSEFWRILKPDGMMFGTSPHWSGPWAWGDPGHTRIIGPETMIFLQQPQYTNQVGVTPMTDYRWIYKADFEPLHIHVTEDKQFHYALKAIKPSRILYKDRKCTQCKTDGLGAIA